jgi:hypothetical protein
MKHTNAASTPISSWGSSRSTSSANARTVHVAQS